MAKHHYYTRNLVGRDIAVGDIHGCYSLLEEGLARIKFDPIKDRLFPTGDLVDKGPSSRQALDAMKDFHSVMGNHDAHVVKSNGPHVGNWLNKSGRWFEYLHEPHQEAFRKAFEQLPIAISVETSQGVVGIVHAEWPCSSWIEGLAILDAADSGHKVNPFLYRRKLFESGEIVPVRDVRAVIHGHCPVPEMVVRGNRYYIDTEAWVSNKFTFLDLETLQEIQPI